MKRWSLGLVLLALCAAWGEDAYYRVPLADLRIVEGQFPPDESSGDAWRRPWEMLRPYAVGEGGEEMYFAFTADRWGWSTAAATWRAEGWLAARAPAGQTPRGALFFPRSDFSGMVRVEFQIDSAPEPAAAGRVEFLRAKLAHYAHLRSLEGPGAAWFRSQVNAARDELAALGEPEGEGVRDIPFRPRRPDGLEESFDLFAGGRAISENLQLDRELNVLSPGERNVDIGSIAGITTAQIDWKELTKAMAPEKDALAACIPEDQHAVFFPSLQEMLDLMDEAESRGTPVLDLLRPRSESVNTAARYQRQLALPVNAIARLVGPRMVRSVAVTGSDPFLPTGTDLAVLLDTPDARSTRAMIATQQAAVAAAVPGARAVSGEIEGVAYSGFSTPRRDISAYVATVGDMVVASNSLAQIARIARTVRGDTPSLASLDEYTFFRDRYALGDEAESALLVLTDATIRRWCGPKWRIAASRRTRAAAAMAEIQARYLAAVAEGSADEARSVREMPGLGEVHVGPDGVWSPVYGSLDFLTPVAELEIDKVTPEERDAYEWFRSRYQMQWRQFFDPIAARVSVGPEKMALDVTVRPLIAASDYRELMRVVGDATIPQGAGDATGDALFQFAMALDPDSPSIREAGSFASSMAPGLQANPLAWLGGWVGAHVDDTPFWSELGAAEADQNGREQFLMRNVSRLPLAISVAVRNPMMAAVFLTAVRSFVEQAAPGMTVWEVREHNGRPYTRISPSAMALEQTGGDMDPAFAIHYAMFGGKLVLTPNEATLLRAMDRQTAREANEAPPQTPERIGDSMRVRARRGALAFLESWTRDDLSRALQNRSWANLPILNEWRRVLNEDDPVAFHRKHWAATLKCPGGGRYVWNEARQTMESTVFGHPGQPQRPEGLPAPLEWVESVGLGLTFEGDGLRARGEVNRAAE